jgi:hypothetical protein
LDVIILLIGKNMTNKYERRVMEDRARNAELLERLLNRGPYIPDGPTTMGPYVDWDPTKNCINPISKMNDAREGDIK